MNPLEYLHLQLRLEGKAVVDGDRLRQVEVVPDEEMPVMVIAQLMDGPLVAYYDEALSPDLQRELAKQVLDLTFPRIEPLLTVLKAHPISVDVGHYKTYNFPATFQQFVDPDVDCHSSVGRHMQRYSIERDGKIVSFCVSTRENGQCAEAWVYTDENYRRQGLAHRVVSAWAKAMFDAGRVPFYSHKVTNIESASLAQRLGLQPVFEEIAMVYMHV
jgi:hypothetical protein